MQPAADWKCEHQFAMATRLLLPDSTEARDVSDADRTRRWPPLTNFPIPPPRPSSAGGSRSGGRSTTKVPLAVGPAMCMLTLAITQQVWYTCKSTSPAVYYCQDDCHAPVGIALNMSTSRQYDIDITPVT